MTDEIAKPWLFRPPASVTALPAPTRPIPGKRYYDGLPYIPMTEPFASMWQKRLDESSRRSIAEDAAKRERGEAYHARNRAWAVEQEAIAEAAAERIEFGVELAERNDLAAAALAADRAKTARTLCRSIGIKTPVFRFHAKHLPPGPLRRKAIADADLIMIELCAIEEVAHYVISRYSVVLTVALIHYARRHPMFSDRDNDDAIRAIANAIHIGLLSKTGDKALVLELDDDGMKGIAAAGTRWTVGCGMRCEMWL